MKINLLYKNIAILGFKKEGNSTLRFLQKNGIKDGNITILDQNKDLKVENFNGKIITGNNYLKNLDQYDYIFKSPGISIYTNNLEYLKNKILTQAKIFFEYYDKKIIGITQTKGKSTTATLVYNLLKNSGYNVKLVGNIGNPVLDEIDLEKDEYDFVVYELSSYMLDDLDNYKSYISIFGNIFPDHIDWHKNFENYFNAKKNILKNSENILVGLDLYPKIKKDLLNRNFLTFGESGAYYSHIGKDYYINNEKILSLNPKIPGNHNLINIAGILGVCDIVGIDKLIFIRTINEFEGLNHRLKNLGEFNQITFIDDAISTTPESTIEAIKTYDQNISTIFLGGTNRGYNFEILALEIEKQGIDNIVLFPDSGKEILKYLKKGNYNILETSSMSDGVKFALKHTKKGKICLLSTASPSYSLWENFEEKGDLFYKEILSQYKDFK
ncbi:UDP-N-acetylmuramoyl-L-alanine--D-glutamate ligase [Candidatus Gracilibacteria bacterium]|nr:UDP-N-acetylmuramoyl-L-alanine--D-glutamate ligase [Candidatus Gracilibacteria bacterium]